MFRTTRERCSQFEAVTTVRKPSLMTFIHVDVHEEELGRDEPLKAVVFDRAMKWANHTAMIRDLQQHIELGTLC